MKYKALKGLQDILPPDIYIWHHIEESARSIFKTYGYQEIKLPIMETTDIFIRSIGESSDIVEKEMYTFQDKGGRSVTLRPEGTAPFVRAYVQHHLYTNPPPQKFYYIGPMFRYERPQAYRYRQFHQIGAEAMGIDDPRLDAEVISMLYEMLKKIGLEGLNFEITSIGCEKCRPLFRDALRDFLKDKIERFCADCQRRYELNPLRILDCKVDSCIEQRKGAPPVLDYLCDSCKDHFERLKACLDLLKIPYILNPNLVRGLDYYTRTAFEVTSESLGSQKAVAAGGRYDRMVDEFGGPPTPGIGFAIGVERIVPLIKEKFEVIERPDIVFCIIGEEPARRGLLITRDLRSRGLWIEMNYENTSLKSQMRKANRMGARYVIVLGEDELSTNTVAVKEMESGKEVKVPLDTEEILKVVTTPGYF